MRKLFVYSALQLKRGIKQLPKAIAFTLILLLAALVLCSVLLSQNANSEKNTMLKVAITGDTDNTFLQLGILAVKEFDSSNTYVEFITTTEDEAMTGLKGGKYSGIVLVPDDFMDAVMNGGKIELKYVTRNSPVALGPLLSNEVVQTASELVGETLTGVIAVQKAAKENDLTEDMDQLVENINIRYVSYVLDRDELYEVSYTGINDGLSFGGYYVCGILFLLILLIGITSAPMMVRDNSSLPRLARARGIGIYKQIFGEYLGFALAPTIIMTLIMLVLSITTSIVTLPIIELQNVYISSALQLLPVILMVCALQMLLYECATGIITGVILQFITAIALAYISGCFYPPYYFPQAIQTIASLLPGGVALDYIACIFNGSPLNALPLLGYTILLLLLAGVIRYLRLRGESK